MKCYICHAPFGDDPSNACPGICGNPECRSAANDPATWEAFLAAKQESILAALRSAPEGAVYMHLMPREQE